MFSIILMAYAEIGGRYRHYKNNQEYIVTALAMHSETTERLVIYEGQYDDVEFGKHPIWARPVHLFEDSWSENGTIVERFVRID